jgi:tRNA (cmo5U34)-methyltransferase
VTEYGDVAERFGPGGWAFTDDVVGEFPEHVRASVPFYDEITAMIAEAADWLVPQGGRVADLGAATGNTCAAIARRHPERDIAFDLYDESKAMLERADELLRELSGAHRRVMHHVSIERGPILHVHADLTLCLFTLQFLRPADRVTALRLAREQSAPTGALVVAEKVQLTDPRWAEIACDASHDWKAGHGLSDTAIRAKARALRGVLVPGTQSELHAVMRAAGWHSPEILFRWHQWTVSGAYARGLRRGA